MIYIKGIIGNDNEEIKLVDVVSQTKNVSGDIEVVITSQGGDLYVAMDIYNYLISLPNKIITRCVGECASAASVIFLAGDVRIAECPIMIHNPYLRDIQGDSKSLKEASDLVGKVEKDLINTYAARTNLDTEVISKLMDNETYLSPKDATSLGFSTESKQIAYAKVDSKIDNNKKNKKMARKYFNFFSKNVYNMLLKTDSGADLEIDREDGEPEKGDSARPNGNHIMEDGTVIVVEDDVIKEIIRPENEGEGDDISVEELHYTFLEFSRRIEGEVNELRRRLDESSVQNRCNPVSSYKPQNRTQRTVKGLNDLGDEIARKKDEVMNRKNRK